MLRFGENQSKLMFVPHDNRDTLENRPLSKLFSTWMYQYVFNLLTVFLTSLTVQLNQGNTRERSRENRYQLRA